MPDKKRTPKVIGYSAAVWQELANRRLDGVVRYMDEHVSELAVRDFRFNKDFDDDNASPPPPWTGIADGVILCFGIDPAITTPEKLAHWVARSGVPAVSLSLDWKHPSIPIVGNDSKALMNLGADYFMKHGYRNIAFLGSTRIPLETANRNALFARRLAKNGITPLAFEISFSPQGANEDFEAALQEEQLIEQLQQAPKPLAVYALSDNYARVVYLLCEHLKLDVPGEVAILGCGNISTSRCNFPTISTVQTDNDRVGYEAARILHRMINGKQPEAHTLLIPPVRVIERQTTSGDLPKQDDILGARDYIREHACNGIGVQDILRKLSISRRTFEAQFLEQTGLSPKQMIQQVRLDRAKHLLANTQLTITQVAMLTGFSDVAAMSNFISKATGKSPSELRG